MTNGAMRNDPSATNDDPAGSAPEETRRATLGDLLAAEARSAPGAGPEEHPEDDALAAYLDGTVSDETTENGDAIRAHLVACRRCTERLLEIETLRLPDAPAAATPSDAGEPVDFARVAAWRAFSAERVRRRAPSRRTWGLVAACLLAVAALAYVLATEMGDAGDEAGFEENLSIHYLDELTRSRSFETSRLEIDADARWWALILTPPAEAEPYPRYAVDLYDPQGELLFRSGELVASDHGTLRLGVPTAAVPAGEARLVLRGLEGEESVEVEEYPLRVVYR